MSFILTALLNIGLDPTKISPVRLGAFIVRDIGLAIFFGYLLILYYPIVKRYSSYLGTLQIWVWFEISLAVCRLLKNPLQFYRNRAKLTGTIGKDIWLRVYVIIDWLSYATVILNGNSVC